MADPPRADDLVAGRDGERLDVFVARSLPGLTRSRARRLIDEGLVTVDGRLPAKAGAALAAGQRVRVTVPPPEPSELKPEAVPLRIVYEDDDLLVVDKPAGMTVHPAPGHTSGTLVHALLAHCPEIALVEGRLKEREGVIDAPIGRHQAQRKKMAVVHGGREARTRYRLLREIGGRSLVEVSPETGRTHQIRVHFAAIGHPVTGDRVYGRGRAAAPWLPRQFLHAQRLAFRHPRTGERLELEAELPDDLEQALASLEQTS